MTFKCHTRIGGRHSATVVDDLYQFAPRIAEYDLYFRGMSVNGIFQQLFDD
jgi:hypothetical protein